MTQKRIPSAIDAVAEDYVDDMLALSPSLALYLGLDGAAGFDDFSPAGLSALNDLTVDTLSRLDDAAAGSELDEVDLVTVDAMRDRLGVDRDSFDAGLKHASLNVIESPLQQARDAFDLDRKSVVEGKRVDAWA